MTIRINPVADGCGFFYGSAETDDNIVRVDILPPLQDRTHWIGKLRSPDIQPDARLWTVFIDGDEIGRVPTRTDVEALITQHTTSGA